MSIDDMIAVLQAAKDGKPVECRRGHNNTWFPMNKDLCGSEWNFQVCEYRVKPEPREWTIALDKSNNRPYPTDWFAYPDKWELVKVREVIEE